MTYVAINVKFSKSVNSVVDKLFSEEIQHSVSGILEPIFNEPLPNYPFQTSTIKVRVDEEIPNNKIRQILTWSKNLSHDDTTSTASQITVALVTQCSVDRLSNLYQQLLRWNGKASVAIYVKSNESYSSTKRSIISGLDETRKQAIKEHGEHSQWDVSVSLVLGTKEEEEFPVNYLRNVALLDAKSQQQQMRGMKGAVLLVDVDFIPSNNLHKALHCKLAADNILEERQVVVIPAFEGVIDGPPPKSVLELERMIKRQEATSFRQKFYRGHGPTNFNQYWKKSTSLNQGVIDEFWASVYAVRYQPYFEPYVVMATEDVPLYDER